MNAKVPAVALSPANAPLADAAKIRVLIVDDHTDLVANIFGYLEPRNFILDAAQDRATALKLCLEYQYDVLVLDWMLPRLAGPDVLAELRRSGADIPILMLTAKTDIADKLSCFSRGADDYLTKPFSIAELEARILALHIRRIGRQQVLQVADLSYNLRTDTVTRGGEALNIHSGGKKLLALLMRESPGVVSKERLESLLWGDELPDKDLLRTHIYELRKRIDAGHAIKLIHSVLRVDYQLSRIADTACSSDRT